MRTSFKVLLIIVNFFFFSCNKEEINTLEVSKDKIEVPAEGVLTSFTIKTNAEAWNIQHTAPNWLNISTKSGITSEALISLNVNSRCLTPRTDTITITAGNANPAYIIVSQVSSEYLHDLTTTRSYAEFGFSSASVSMNITSETPTWSLSCDADWVSFSQTSGAKGTFSVNISVSSNPETSERSATITLSGEGAPTYEIPVTQKGAYPSYNTKPIDPDITGMSKSAMEIASEINLGWNIGNTMEAIGGETAWGNPKITEEYVKFVKQNSFNAIRIPCSWNQYLEKQSTAQIKTQWLNRVKEVVQYCVNNDLYVILNIHWDDGWLEENCTLASQIANNAKQKAFWEQIATHLRDFDEHLIFASANEPNVKTATEMKVLLSYHQTFINAVRSTGGKNTYRVLVVQGPSTDIEKTNSLMNTMPSDNTADRMMAEVHYYTPYQFCLMTEDASWGKMFYYWGKDHHSTIEPDRNATWGEENDVDLFFAMMKTKFVDKGIPVILGEYGAYRRDNNKYIPQDLETHNAAVDYWITYVTKKAIANGLEPFFWDTGGALDRRNYTVIDQRTIDALKAGAQ